MVSDLRPETISADDAFGPSMRPTLVRRIQRNPESTSTPTSAAWDVARRVLGEPEARPILDGTSYDTAWLATVPSAADPRLPRYPQALAWIERHQLPDGSWGGDLRYEHDRVISTLSALSALGKYERTSRRQESMARGTRYLWRNGHRLQGEPVELVGFELLLPTMIETAKAAGVSVPPFLHVYESERAAKLRLIPPDVLYSPHVTVTHSLEFLGHQAQVEGLARAQFENGSIGNSPAATAFYAGLSGDSRALAYLDGCLERGAGSVVPVLYPCETFELLWAAYHLFLGGVSPRELLNRQEQEALALALAEGGVSLSPTFPVPDADDTAVALILLNALGWPVDAGVLAGFALPDGHFASFPLERHPSVGVNLHVLHALLRVPGYPDSQRVVERLVDYIIGEQRQNTYWVDKWHMSPYYATAHALLVFAELPRNLTGRVEPAVRRAREWLLQSGSEGNAWGFGDRPTAEETAYAVLGLSSAGFHSSDHEWTVAESSLRTLEAAVSRHGGNRDLLMPPQWIDKCLYSPRLVVRSVIESAILRLRQGNAVQLGAA